MDLNGRWKGQYTYGKGYSSNYIGKSESFEFYITEKNGSFTGSCIDEVVKSVVGNESYIAGNFNDGEIRFKKRYKIHTVISDAGVTTADDTTKHDGVDYKGKLKKKLFSKERYFVGKWSITCEFRNVQNIAQTFVCEGSWKMYKVLNQ